jgi:hypothetical protein
MLIGAHCQSGRYLAEPVADESFGTRLMKLLRVRMPRSLWWKREDLTVIQTFADRFRVVRERVGPLVWGLDPSSEVLGEWGLGDSPDGLDRFVDIVVEVASAPSAW